MIRNDAELRETQRRVDEQKICDATNEAYFKSLGLSTEEVEMAMGPTMHLRAQMEHDIATYTKLKSGDLSGPREFSQLGRFLVEVRIARGLSLRELAKRLGIDESAVSRDERNEYHGVSVDRACRILEALDVEVNLIGAVRTPVNLTSHALDSAWNDISVSSSSVPDIRIISVSKHSVRSAEKSSGHSVESLFSMNGAA